MNYYNENDKLAAGWLRRLIKSGRIPDGYVDERSIVDVKAEDLDGFTQCHFFAGIGGWPYALGLAGWPEDKSVWTGSCPCQPFSIAGKGGGTSDARHLWPVWKRLIRECRPATVFGEQVGSPAGRKWLNRVFAYLEIVGYRTAGADLCAAIVGAPHVRQRLFWVADSGSGERGSGSKKNHEQSAKGDTHRPGSDGVLADSNDRGPQVNWTGGTENDGAKPLADDGATTSECGETVWLSDSDSERCTGEQIHGGRSIETAGSCGHCGLSDSDRPRRGEQCRAVAVGQKQLAAECVGGCSWSDFDIIPFRDGKYRRIESGISPLVDGFPGRVGLLRGYGNAIVAPLAAKFITASNEAGGK